MLLWDARLQKVRTSSSKLPCVCVCVWITESWNIGLMATIYLTVAPPPKVPRDSSRRTHTHNNGTTPQNADPFKEDLFGSTPFNPASASTLSAPPIPNR